MLDIEIGSPEEGFRLIPMIRELDPLLPIVMCSGRTDFAAVREALRLGATDYLPKDSRRTISACARAGARAQASREAPRAEDFEVLNSPRSTRCRRERADDQLRHVIESVRASSANVVITGETGTGKEAVARQLRGKLPDGSLAPFQAVDSSTITSSMAESLLFGHEKGAFTGAERTTKGIFEEADGGIVYFDEIGNMPLEIQVQTAARAAGKGSHARGLLARDPARVPRRSARRISISKQLAAVGRFKADLLQRLNVIPIALPPLRERTEDIPALVAHFLKRDGASREFRFADEALETLKSHAWPGNVRELANLVCYVTTMSERPGNLRGRPAAARKERAGERGKPAEDEARASTTASPSSRSSILTEEYARNDGNVSRLALTLGMDRSHLYTKLREHGIHATSKSRARARDSDALGFLVGVPRERPSAGAKFLSEQKSSTCPERADEKAREDFSAPHARAHWNVHCYRLRDGRVSFRRWSPRGARSNPWN